MSDFKFKSGAIPSIPDDRDRQLEKFVSCTLHLPKEFMTDIPFDIWNQGDSSECVACSLSLIRYIQEYNQSGNRNQFSPSFIYGRRDDDMYQGEGMYPREALKILKNYGVVHYDDLPGFFTYPEAQKICKEKEESFIPIASPYKISSYYAVSTLTEIRNAIYKLNAVSAMFPVYDCLNDTGEDGIVKYTKESSKYNYGFHQMTIIGWTENHEWIVVNSWGKEFGKNGLIYIPFDYPINEAWAVVDDILENKFVTIPES